MSATQLTGDVVIFIHRTNETHKTKINVPSGDDPRQHVCDQVTRDLRPDAQPDPSQYLFTRSEFSTLFK